MNTREKIKDVIWIMLVWLTAIAMLLLVITKLRFKLLMALLILISFSSIAQDSTGKVTVSAYVESYYTYDFNKPLNNYRPNFFYSHSRHNEFNVNIALMKASYTTNKFRSNIALAAGTYMNANYAAEPGVFKNIFEANIGIKLGKRNLWIDAGIMPSHIGFESAISKDCWNLTRSILADNSPYFEAGAKITYTSGNSKWLISVMALNGWQRITRVDGNSLMSCGIQVQYKPSGKILLNYSNFIGTDKPDSARLNRLFHNIYGIFNITDKFGATAGFDIGTEEKFPGSNDKNIWFSPVFNIRYLISDKWAIAARGEYYKDKNGVIIATGTPNGFNTTGFSFNIDHNPVKNLILRFEIRSLASEDKIFGKGNSLSKNNISITSSAAITF